MERVGLRWGLQVAVLCAACADGESNGAGSAAADAAASGLDADTPGADSGAGMGHGGEADGEVALRELDAAGGGSSPAAIMEEECGGLPAVVRDFSSSHPDFEAFWGNAASEGIVNEMLDDQGRPTLTGAFFGSQVTSEEDFAQWYADVPDVNERVELELPLTEVSAGQFVFDSADESNPFGGAAGFFPVDDLAGGELATVTGLQPDPSLEQSHNFHFTTELHATFVYRGGELFTFSGDDDVWVFANGRLALDLGGLHGRLEGTIDFDAMREALQLTEGETYPLDVFHAERHTHESNFRIETTIDCFTPVVIQ